MLLKHEIAVRSSRNGIRSRALTFASAFADIKSGSFKSGAVGQRIKTIDTVFRIAILMGSVAAVEVLLLWGGDAFLSDLKHNPLILACQRGNKEIVQKLHEYHANINMKTEVRFAQWLPGSLNESILGGKSVSCGVYQQTF